VTVPALDRDGVKIHYEVHGTATERMPLLLSHGYGASSVMWPPNLAAIGADRTVVTWDLRGHGYSDSPTDPACYSEAASVADMAAILDACDISRAAIGGLSLGGYLSLAFHLTYPERCAALLLFDTGPGYKQTAGRDQWNRMVGGIAADFDRRGLHALPDSPEVGGGRHDPAGLALAARGILVQHDDRVITSLPHIAVPTLVVVGEHDRQFLAAADYLAAKITGATKVVIPGAGHASNIDRPTAFNQAVTEFLGQTRVG
jgi:pimeloyl-ACP methyl ester carboxylesterase